MKSSDNVFVLIKSLTKAEKRHFKIFATKHVIGEQNNYVVLFDTINALKEYDESAVKQRLAATKLVSRLAVEKVHLYNLILRSLRSFHQGRSGKTAVGELIDNAELLADKGLLPQSAKIIRKAKTLAYRYEEFGLLLRLIDLERKLLKKSKDISSQAFEQLAQESREVTDSISNIAELKNLYDQAFALSRQGQQNTNEESKQAFKNLVRHPLLHPDSEQKTFTATYYRHLIFATYARAMGNFDAALGHSRKVLELCEQTPHTAPEHFHRHMHVLSNYLSLCIRLHRFEEYARTVVKFDLLPARSREAQADVFQQKWNLELLFLLNTGRIEQARACIPQIEKGLRSFAELLDTARAVSIYYNIALLHFILSEFPAMRPWLLKIKESSRTGVRSDIRQVALMLEWIAYYEDKSSRDDPFSNIPSDIASAATGFAAIVSKHLQQLIRSSTNADAEVVFSALRVELISMHNDPRKSYVAGLQEILQWVESKLSGKALADIYRAGRIEQSLS